MSFRSGAKTFVLVTLHVLYGEDEEERLPEITAIAGWLAGWAKDINGWDHNLIALGDFNIDRRGDALHDAFVSTGLDIPEDLQSVPRTIFSDPDKPHLDKFYDQIVWFTGRGGPARAVAALLARGLLRLHEVGVDVAGAYEDAAVVAALGPLPAVGRVLRAQLASAACKGLEAERSTAQHDYDSLLRG